MANFNNRSTRQVRSWSEMFPEGRDLFYEGDDPEGFCAEMKERFGFDPSEDNDAWGEWIDSVEIISDDGGHYAQPDGGEGFYSYSFHCPPQHLDVIYNGDYPLGS